MQEGGIDLDKKRLYPRYIVIHHTGSRDVPILNIDRYHSSLGWGVIVTSPQPLVNDLIQKGFNKTRSGVMVSVGYHYLIRKNGKIENGRLILSSVLIVEVRNEF